MNNPVKIVSLSVFCMLIIIFDSGCSTSPDRYLSTSFKIIEEGKIYGSRPLGSKSSTMVLESDVMARTFVRTRFPARGAHPELLFAHIREPSQGYTMPIVLVVEDGLTEVLQIPSTLGNRWIYTARDLDSGRVWGLIRGVVESSGDTIEVMLSNDAGRTWIHVSRIVVPHYSGSRLTEFIMDDHGRGSIRLYWDNIAACCGEGQESFVGYFVYRTRDWGHTWKEPRAFKTSVEQQITQWWGSGGAYIYDSNTGHDYRGRLLSEFDLDIFRDTQSKDPIE